MFKNAKKLLSILLVAAVLITAIPFGAFAAETTEATATNILEDEKAYASFARAPLAQRLVDGDAQNAQIADAHFELANVAPTESLYQNYSQQPASNVASVSRHTHKTETESATNVSVYSEGMYDEDVMRDLVKEGNETIYSFQISDAANHRTAFVFRLGGYYNVDTFKLTQSINASCGCNRAIQKFTVYAGNELNGSIWQNPVGTGGSNKEDEMVVTLNGANAVKYLVVVLDVVMPPSMNNIWTPDYYNASYIKGFAAYGEETEAPVENVLANENAVVGEYKINLADALVDGDTLETVISKLNYDNLSTTSGTIKYVSGFNGTEEGRNIYELKTLDADGVNLTKAQAFDMLEDTTNIQPFRFDIGGLTARYAIGYDLGDEYTLDKFVLTQNLNNVDPAVRKVYRYSVYAGNTLDATIFENCVGVGGSTIDKDMAIDLEGATNVRYVLVVLDHMTRFDDGSVCPYSYFANITNIAAYGTKRENLAAKDTTVGNLYSIELDTEIPAGLTPDEMQPYLVYKNIKDVNLDNTSYSEFWFNNSTTGTRPSNYTSNDEVIKKAIVEKGNTEKIVITSESSYGYNIHRAALGFDLGANYNLEKLQLTQSTDCDQDRNIYRYSVYAGDVFNASIFNEENKIATGGGDTTEIGTTFKEGASGRYVVIVFDHVSLNWTKNSYHKNAYIPFGIDNIVLHGEEAPVTERENILTKTEVIGDLYTTDLAVALPAATDPKDDDDATVKDVYDEVRYPYNNLTANYASFSNTSGLGLTNDQIIDQLILTDKNAVGTNINVTNPLERRVGIGFDLGGYYNLDTLKLYQGDSLRPIYNISIYAGNKMDGSIFSNRVGIASTANACEQYKVALEGAEKVRYILVMFDHVAMHSGDTWGGYVHQYAYYPKVNDMMLYGEASSAPDVAKIGEVGYASLEEAVAAANDGDTITLLADVAIDEQINLPVGVTLDGGNFTLDATALGDKTADGTTAAIYSTGAITVKNITIDGAARGIYVYPKNVALTADVVVDNVTIVNSCRAINVSSTLMEHPYGLKVSNSTLAGKVSYTQCLTSADFTNVNFVTNGGAKGDVIEPWGGTTFTACTFADGYTMSVEDLKSDELVAKDENTVIEAPEGYKWVDGVLTAIVYVAKVGDNKYEVFADALAAANDGDTITLLADANTADIEIAGKALTFDLNGNTINGTVEKGLFVLTDGATLTVQNGTLVSSYVGIRSNGNGTAANTIVVDNVDMTSNYFGIYHNGNNYGVDVTVNGSTITDNFDAGIYLSGRAAWGENRNSLTITDSTVSGASAVEVKHTDVIVEGSTLTATGSYVVINNSNGTCTGGYALALTNNTYNNTDATTGTINIGEGNTLTGGVMVKAEAEANDVVVVGDTTAIEIPEDYKWVDGVLVAKEYVAQIGDDKYEVFADALAAAVDGDIITLLADVNTADIAIEGKALTFDLNGNTINGTVEKGLFVLTDGATLKVQNGTVVSSYIGIRSNGNGTAANTIVVDNVDMTSNYFGIYHNGNNYGVNVTVNGSTITDNFDAGIYLSGNASWGENRNSLTITDSAVSGASAVEVKHTDVTVTGSTLTATLTGEKVLINNANGTCTGGYALALTNNTTTKSVGETAGTITLGEGNTLNGGVMIKAEAETNDVVVNGDTTAIEIPEDYKWIDGKLTLKADIDGDGDVTAQDLVKAKKMLLGVQTKDDTLDITGDGIFNILDFIAIHKLVG
ncbi:MAG: hypothetical protein E7561_05785 [Ruminococcaceae bacterium]|nr:hypothetical protein [Oscillospiraceae bacterium]